MKQLGFLVRFGIGIGIGLTPVLACDIVKSPHDLAFSANGVGKTVRVDPGRVYGADIEVDKYEDGYRGTWRGRTIELRVQPERVLGTIGATPIDIHVKEENGVLQLQGMVGGRLGNLSVSSDRVDGQFGGCGYDLKKDDDGFRGIRCNAAIAVLRFPEGWNELSASERAAFLALILSG